MSRPFIRHVAHVFRNAVAHPCHELTVELEIRPTLLGKEAPSGLRIPVIRIDFHCARNFSAMPIELHDAPKMESVCGRTWPLVRRNVQKEC
jgi:hypothetical protein